MKVLFSILLLFSLSIIFAQTDSSTTVSYRKYPEDFQRTAFRFKPFMVIQSTLAGEIELFSKKRPASFVFGAEATLLRDNLMDIVGGAIESDRRAYLNRSISNKENSEFMFYISYGLKFSHYQFKYDFEDYYGYNYYDYISVEDYFSQLALNLKVGIQFLAFEKISIDTNLGAGVRYNTKRLIDESYYFSKPYTFDAIIRHGIQPTIHLAIGLAN